MGGRALTDWPPIRRGIGKLTPDRWARLGRTVGAFEAAGATDEQAPAVASTRFFEIVGSTVPAGQDRLYTVKRVGHLSWASGAAAWSMLDLPIEARSLAEVGTGTASVALPNGSKVVGHLLAGRWWFAGQVGGISSSAVCTPTSGDRISNFGFTPQGCALFPAGTATNMWSYADVPPAGTTVTVLPSAQTSIPVWACYSAGAWTFSTHVVCPLQVVCV